MHCRLRIYRKQAPETKRLVYMVEDDPNWKSQGSSGEEEEEEKASAKRVRTKARGRWRGKGRGGSSARASQAPDRNAEDGKEDKDAGKAVTTPTRVAPRGRGRGRGRQGALVLGRELLPSEEELGDDKSAEAAVGTPRGRGRGRGRGGLSVLGKRQGRGRGRSIEGPEAKRLKAEGKGRVKPQVDTGVRANQEAEASAEVNNPKQTTQGSAASPTAIPPKPDAPGTQKPPNMARLSRSNSHGGVRQTGPESWGLGLSDTKVKSLAHIP